MGWGYSKTACYIACNSTENWLLNGVSAEKILGQYNIDLFVKSANHIGWQGIVFFFSNSVAIKSVKFLDLKYLEKQKQEDFYHDDII